VEETQTLSRSLALVQSSQSSKEKILLLLKGLSEKMPSRIHLIELRLEEKDFYLKAESPTHGLASEAVEMVSGLGLLEEVKLGQTRLLKRLNEDTFEFEITGKWKS
jgi:predicted ABC-type transport system involved in lysophospholipase L1 biosynthesis ATPase subunit